MVDQMRRGMTELWIWEWRGKASLAECEKPAGRFAMGEREALVRAANGSTEKRKVGAEKD